VNAREVFGHGAFEETLMRNSGGEKSKSRTVVRGIRETRRKRRSTRR
jgi:hypothetical protein